MAGKAANKSSSIAINSVSALLDFEHKLRQATTPAQLYHTVVNLLHQCVPFTQSILLLGDDEQSLNAVAASDIPTLDYTSPFVTLAEQLCQQLRTSESSQPLQPYTPADVNDALRTEWQSLSPEQLLKIPLRVAAGNGRLVGVLLLFRQQHWTPDEYLILQRLADTIAHALQLYARQRPVKQRTKQVLKQLRRPKVATITAFVLCSAMFLPVRLSSLAPYKVIPSNPVIVSAPLNGTVKQVTVQPNQTVEPGDLLVQLEDTALASEYEVAQQALLVARAELKTVQQSGFLDPAKKARLAELESKVRLRQSEQSYALSRYQKSAITASSAGIAVVGDPDEWSGRPVSTGERILLLADPAQVEIEILLPVQNAISISTGADVRLFPDSSPLNTHQASIRYASYDPQFTPEQQLAYRLVATLATPDQSLAPPRIGARGTAKVYSKQVTLFFYLFRRPLTALRQWLGW
ncbi:HlyD family efflux transporter periplasmic adaptor subunit [Endozoicomonadaceae bacterium StTr2]